MTSQEKTAASQQSGPLHSRPLVANPQVTANLRRQSSGPAWLVASDKTGVSGSLRIHIDVSHSLIRRVARGRAGPFCAGVSCLMRLICSRAGTAEREREHHHSTYAKMRVLKIDTQPGLMTGTDDFDRLLRSEQPQSFQRCLLRFHCTSTMLTSTSGPPVLSFEVDGHLDRCVDGGCMFHQEISIYRAKDHHCTAETLRQKAAAVEPTVQHPKGSVSGPPRGVEGGHLRDATNDLTVETSSRQRLAGGEHHEETDRRRRETFDESIGSAVLCSQQ